MHSATKVSNILPARSAIKMMVEKFVANRIRLIIGCPVNDVELETDLGCFLSLQISSQPRMMPL